MSDPVIYRSSDPEVVSDYKRTGEEYLEWLDKCVAFAKSVHPDAKPMKTTDFGGDRFGGITFVEPIPEGWRRQKQKGLLVDFLVPLKKSKVGKEWAAKLDDLWVAPNPRKALAGMPHYLFLGLSGQAPGVVLYDDTLYVEWGKEALEQLEKEVDVTIWERMRLSEYYALKEKRERTDA